MNRRSLLALSLALAALVGCDRRDEPFATTTSVAAATPSGAPSVSPTPSPSASAGPSEGFKLLVIGDYGNGTVEEAAVADSVRAVAAGSKVDALVTTGDNVYPSGRPENFSEAWTIPYGWVSETGLPLIASLGNHDVQVDGGVGVMNLLGMPGPWYSKVVGSSEIFVLDANRPSDPQQLEWMQRQLAASSARWKIAVFHQGPFSCSEHDGDPTVEQTWLPIFEREGVDLVLTGHDHNYQRFAETDGIDYVVTGGGGAQLYPVDECPSTYPQRLIADDDHFHHLQVEGSADSLSVRAVSPDGLTLDEFSIQP
jgi:3',5'-cyclic AMP phosphodiesterase CpdA